MAVSGNLMSIIGVSSHTLADTESTDLTAEGPLGEGGSASDGEQRLLSPSDLRMPGLQAVLLVGQQVVVHGVHKQAVTLRVQHHAGHRLDQAHQLTSRDGLKAYVGQELCSVGLACGIEIQPPHGQLKREMFLQNQKTY